MIVTPEAPKSLAVNKDTGLYLYCMNMVHRPVAIRLGGIGDHIALQPALARLHRSYGVAPLLVGDESWAGLTLEGQPAVDEILLWHADRLPTWLSPHHKALAKALRAHLPAPVYLFTDSGPMRDLLALAGVGKGDLVDARHYPRSLREHRVAYAMRLAAECPPSWQSAFSSDPALRDVPAPVLEVPDRQRRECLSWLTGKQWDDRPIILIQTCCQTTLGDPVAEPLANLRWPERHWAALIDALSVEAEGVRFLLCGTPAESTFHRGVLELCRYRRVASVAEELTTARLLPLLEHAHSVVSGHAGLAQTASALNCPTVALFGWMDPFRSRPLRRLAPVVTVTPQGLDWQAWAPGDLDPQLAVAGWRQLAERAPWPISPLLRRRRSALS